MLVAKWVSPILDRQLRWTSLLESEHIERRPLILPRAMSTPPTHLYESSEHLLVAAAETVGMRTS